MMMVRKSVVKILSWGKEQYLYIYRSDIFNISDQYHYDDGSEERGEDTFMRWVTPLEDVENITKSI